jgi:hypothetical protein
MSHLEAFSIRCVLLFIFNCLGLVLLTSRVSRVSKQDLEVNFP